MNTLGLLNLGGAEILILLTLFFLVPVAAVAVLVVVLVRKRSAAPPGVKPFTAPLPADVEQQLKTLVRLKEQRLLNDQEFETKRKAILGL